MNAPKRKSSSQLKDEFDELRSHLIQLESRITDIEKFSSSSRKKLEQHDNDINALRTSISEIENSRLDLSQQDVLDEMEERELRRDNIAVFGIFEKTNGSLSERIQHDQEEVEQLFETMELPGLPFVHTRRVGRTVTGKSRPLIVKLRSRLDKPFVLRNTRLLKSSDKFKRTYVSNDLTKRQQNDRRKLRQELKNRWDAGEDVVIYKGKVCSRDSVKNFRI